MFIKYISIVLVAILYIKLNPDKKFRPEEDVHGKNVLVTGASGGIGEQLAYHYARMGANVFITARRKAQLQQVLQKCKSLGQKDAKFGFAAADMEMYEVSAPNIISDAVQVLGGLDHVVLNHALLTEFSRWRGHDEDLRMYEKSIDINLMSHVYLASHALPHLRNSSHGRLAVVSSLGGKIDLPYMSSYSSSKFGLDGFFSALRQELKNAKESITVTLCLLGRIATDRGTEIFQNFETNFNVDVAKMMKLNPSAGPSDTAVEIIKATVLGQRELYYPPILGSTYVPQLLPAIRHLFPAILELDIDFFKKTS